MTERIGGKVLLRVLETAVVLITIGSCVGYQMTVVKLTQFLLVNLLGFEALQIYSWEVRLLIGAPTVFLIVFPLSMMRNLHDFRYLSFGVFGCIIYTIGVGLCELPAYASANYAPEKVLYFSFGWQTFQALAIGMFTFTNHLQIIPIYSELIAPTRRRMNKVIIRATSMIGLINAISGLSGYFSTYDETNALMLERLSVDGTRINFSILVANLAMIFLMFIHIPVNYVTARDMITHTLFKTDEISQRDNVKVTFSFCALLLLIPTVFPDLIKFLSLVGGLCCPLICYLIPTILYVMLKKKNDWKCKASVCFCLFLTTCGFLSVAITVYQMATL